MFYCPNKFSCLLKVKNINSPILKYLFFLKKTILFNIANYIWFNHLDANENDALWDECIELEGCHTQADTEEELYKYMKEVLDLYLNEPEGSERVAPLPKEKVKGNDIVQISVDPKIAFGLYMRYLRRKHKFTQQQLADMLGMKNIYSYQRLEKKANPTLTLLEKVKQIYPEFNLDELL